MSLSKLTLEVSAQSKHSFGKITQKIVSTVNGDNSQAVITRSGDLCTNLNDQPKAYIAQIDITDPVPDAVEALLQMELPEHISLRITV